MSQTTYQNSFDVGFAGAFRECQSTHSKVAKDSSNIEFGRVLARQDTAGDYVRKPYSNTAVLVFDADLVTSNNVAFNFYVDGVATAISENFSSNHLTTMQAIETALEAITGVASATISGASNRTLTIVADEGSDIYSGTVNVTGGASQAGVTVSNSDSADRIGVSLHDNLQPNSDGTAYYDGSTADPDQVPVGRKVIVWMYTDANLNPGDDVYVRYYQESGTYAKRGMLTNAAGSAPTKAALWSNAEVVTAGTANGLVEIQINLP